MRYRRLFPIVFLAALIAASSADCRRAEIPKGKFYGTGMITGGNPETDDQTGPPEDVMRKLYLASGANHFGAGVGWGDIEPNPPVNGKSRYVWTSLSKDWGLNVRKPGAVKVVGFGLSGKWQDALKKKDEQRWWELAERWITAAAKVLRAKYGVEYYDYGDNESSLRADPEWAKHFAEPVRHVYDAIKKADPRNKLITGRLVAGSEDLVDAYYKGGLEGHYDVLDLHCYGTAKTHVSIEQIIDARKAMVKHGDADKRIFLGEGWSVFPLPPYLENSKADTPVTPEEIEHYRRCLFRGYRNLVTPRPGEYDPDWVIGARFFLMNDFWQCLQWKKRAVEYRDEHGNIDHWILDGYFIPYRPGEMDAKYRRWGFVDINGNPKGDLVFSFPPYIPKDEFTYEFKGPKPECYLAGRKCSVDVKYTNKESTAFENPRFNVTSDDSPDRAVRSSELSAGPVPSIGIEPGQTVIRTFEFTVPLNRIGDRVRPIGELDYTWEGKPYYSDVWLPRLPVKAAASMRLIPTRLTAEETHGTAAFELQIENHQPEVLQTTITIKAPGQVSASPSEMPVTVSGGETRKVGVCLSLAPNGKAGRYGAEVEAGPLLGSAGALIAFPEEGVRAYDESVPAGQLVNPSFELIGGGSGFFGWDGTTSNWFACEDAKHLQGAGKQCYAFTTNGVEFDYTIGQTVEAPADLRPGKLVGAGIWFKGAAHTGNDKHWKVKAALTLKFLDAEGKKVREDKSKEFEGTGKWARIELRSQPAPSGTAQVRFEIRVVNSDNVAWHQGLLDLAELNWNLQ